MTTSNSKALNVALWVAQALLFLAFAGAGFIKVTTPVEELATKMAWAAELPNLVRFIGVSELLGAVGVILPALTRIKPVLTPTAAAALVVVMVLALGYHISHGETAMVGGPLVLGALATFVAWGRFLKAPIAPRG